MRAPCTTHSRLRPTRVAALASFVVGLAATLVAHGQSAPPRAVQGGLEEIVVTAQKRVERLQDVPISVQAVSGEMLEDMGVQNFENFEVPGVRVSRGGMADTITVRGIGSGQNLGFEQSAPMYIDGVYYGRARTQRLGFLDLERIELLKGPQPTFLGKNATGGAINITTRKPGRELEGDVEASFEPVTDEYALSGAVSVPLGERWAVRGAARYRDSEGYITNTLTGNREPAVEDKLARLTFVGDPTDALRVTAIGYYAGNVDVGRNNQATICEPNYRRDVTSVAQDPCLFDRRKAAFAAAPAAAEAARPDLYRDANGASFLSDMDAYGGSVQLDWELPGGLSFTSLSAYYEYESYQFIDTDQGAANFATASFTENFDQLSQEFRLVSPQDGALRWFLGVYADRNNNDVVSASNFDARNLIPFTPPAVPPQTNRTPAFVANNTAGSVSTLFENAEAWAVFGDASYAISDQFSLRGGLRYEEVKKDVASASCIAAPYVACTPVNDLAPTAVTERTDTKLQPALTLEYRPLTDVMLYASYKEGFKSGGFSGTDAGPFEPEKASAWEVGAKTRLYDNRILFNLTLFRGTYDDLQVSSFDPVTNLFATTNAASAKNQGAELELQFAATEALRLSLNVAYLDATYERFTNSPCWGGQLVLGTGCGPSPTNPAVNVQNLSGVVLPYAPEWSGNAAADYRLAVGDQYALRFGTDVFFTTEFATLTDINPRSFQGGFAKVNARIAFGRADEVWELALVGRNLTDKRTAAFKNTIPGGFFSIASFTEPPATYTVQARYRF